MPDLQVFTAALKGLGDAFGKVINGEMTLQYFNALGDLNDAQIEQLFHWAVQNIEDGFPKIATLKQYARTQGWCRANSRRCGRDIFVYVDCPRCDGRFVVMRVQLEQDARAGRSYRCFNHEHCNCPVVFSAQTIFAKENK